MNKKSILGTLTIATVFLFSYTIICQAQTVESITPKQARKWTEQGEWTNGFKATPHKTTDYVEFATQYRKNKELWDKTFRWLAEHDLTTIPVGKYEIDGKRCYINVQEAKTQDASKRKIESHRHCIDLQYVVKGTERFGLIALKDATPITEYKPDVTFYKSSKVKYIDSTPDEFFMFFPKNCHQALVKANEEEDIRVIVAKIEYIP